MNAQGWLDGHVAVVTGASRGIGHATARVLARAGAAVVVAARSADDLEETVEQVRQEGGRAHAVATDVSDWDAALHLAAETKRVFGPADVVVANAGIVKPVGDTWEVAAEDWAHNVQVNLIGAFYTVRAFLPSMVARGRGVLIMVSSGAAAHPAPGWSGYAAAKAGLDHFVRTLAAELDEAGVGVRVHALYPGVVDTSMQQRIRELPEDQFGRVERYRGYYRRGQLRPPEQPAALIWWLATPMAAGWHGRVSNLDDPAIRERIAADLDVPVFAGRDG